MEILPFAPLPLDCPDCTVFPFVLKCENFRESKRLCNLVQQMQKQMQLPIVCS